MGLFGLGKDTLGEVPVPGQGTITLPAGKVEFRYVEDRKGRHVDTDGKTWRGPSKDLVLTVTPAGGGEPLTVKPPRMISEGSGRTIHKVIGTADLPAGGDYVISSSMTVVEGDHHSPRIVARA